MAQTFTQFFCEQKQNIKHHEDSVDIYNYEITPYSHFGPILTMTICFPVTEVIQNSTRLASSLPGKRAVRVHVFYRAVRANGETGGMFQQRPASRQLLPVCPTLQQFNAVHRLLLWY